MGSRRSPFDPVAHGLDKDFQLTNYTFTDPRGVGWKVPQKDLLKLLDEFKDDGGKSAEEMMLQRTEFGELLCFMEL